MQQAGRARQRRTSAGWRVVRWTLALALMAWALIMVAVGRAHVCEQQVGDGARVVTVCHPAGAADGVTLALVAVLMVLLLPDVTEVGIGGVLTLRRRLTEASIAAEDARRDLFVAQTRQISASSASAVGNAVTILNAAATSAFAVDEAPDDELVVGVQTQGELGEGERLIGELRFALAERVMRGLDATRGPSLDDARLHLYLPDDAAGALLPVLDEPDRDTEGWPMGAGLVGRAWSEQVTTSARGEEVVASLDGVTEHRRRRYAKLSAVVATPVLNAGGRPIGVLSVASIDPQTQIDSVEAVEELEATAALTGRLLVDVLGWAHDD